MEPNTSCHLWIKNTDGGGYGKLWVGGKEVKSHRFAWQIFRGPIPEGLHVLHKCDTPACCNPDHLFLGTPADNAADKIKKGRANYSGKSGIQNNANKLTEEQVIQIRDLQGAEKRIGELFGVSGRTVASIRKGQTWRHI